MFGATYPPRRILIEILLGLCGVWLLWLAWQADARWFERHVLLLSFVVSPISRWFCRFGRGLLLALGLILLVLGRPRVGRLMAAQSLGAVLGQAARILLAVILALGFSEGALRFLQHRSEARRRATQPAGRVSWSPICELDARYGYVFVASQETQQNVGARKVPLAINAQHNRAASTRSEPEQTRPTILFAGESITVGSGLYYEETFPALVGRRLGVQEVNLAALGYGSDQAYLRLVDALPRYSRAVAVVTLFLPGMLSRNFLSWRAHLDFDFGGALVVRPPYKQPELLRLLGEKFPFWTDAAIERSLALSRAIFIDTVKQARSRGAVPLFIIPNQDLRIPRGTPADQRPEWWILRELFERDQLPYLIVDLDEKSEIPGDGHPNARGAAQLADAVVAYLRPRLRHAPSDGDEQPALVR